MEENADEIMGLATACDRRARSVAARDGGGWSGLPMDVLYQVICRLPPPLNGRFNLSLAAVCRHWHAAVRLLLPSALPKLCLAVPDGIFFTFQPKYPGLKLRTHINNPNCRSYRGATDSQLLLATNTWGVYCLMNPFTGMKRLLPIPSIHQGIIDEEGYLREEMPVRKLVVCPHSGLVAAILGHEYSAKVALFAPESAAWSWSVGKCDPWRSYADMVFFDGKLYALTHDEDLLALEVSYDEVGQPRISSVERVIEGDDGVLKGYTWTRYLVVRPCGGGLLMVRRILMEYFATTSEFSVFEADLLSPRWVEVDTLGGDEALFVSRLSSRAVRAGRHGLRGDQIFFLDDSARMQRPRVLSAGSAADAFANVYDMKDRRVSEVLEVQPYRDGTLLATWLFWEDADVEE